MKITDDIKRTSTDPLEEVISDEIGTIKHRQRILSALKRNEQKKWEEENRNNFDILYQKQKKVIEEYHKKLTAVAFSSTPSTPVTVSANYIGERIQFCLEQNNQEIAEFSRNVDISRSSLHRYINGTHLPSKKNLLKIIDGLFITPTDFSYLPDDFEEWKKLFDPEQDGEDIFAVSDYILRKLKTNKFTYEYNGKTMRLPNRYFTLFRKLVTDAVDILDLLPHDKE